MIRICFLVILAIFVMGCNIDLDPCIYEVGETIELFVYETGYVGSITLNRSDCESPAILKIVDGPIWREAGDLVKVKVTRVNHSNSYDVRVLK